MIYPLDSAIQRLNNWGPGSHVVSRFEHHLRLAGTFCLDLMSSVFLARDLCHSFIDETFGSPCLLHFVYYLSNSFQFSFFIWENLHSKIIRKVDIMLAMCSAHFIGFFDPSKISLIDRPISITSFRFSN